MPSVLPGTHLEIDVAQRAPVARRGRVGEVHLLEPQDALAHLERYGIRVIGDTWLEVQHVEEASAARRGTGDGVDHPADLAHRHLQDGHEGEALGELAERDLAGHRLFSADPQDKAHGGKENECHARAGAHEEGYPAMRQGQRACGDGVVAQHLIGR